MENKKSSEKTLAALMRLGLSQYEARAYCALLEAPPMNGHEVSKMSGIPPSKIYETLQRLEIKGAVLMTRSEPVRYTAVSHSKFIGALRQQFEADLTTAENGLAQLPASHTNGLIWSLRSTEGVVSAIRNTIEDAKYEVHAALWDKELEYVAPCLEQASARGIEVHVAVYGRRVLDGPVCYDLTLCGESSVIRLAGRRLSAVVADQAKAVIAEFRADDAVEALVTDSPLVSLLAVEYIKGDVLGRLIINEMGQDVFEHLRESSSSFRSILSARPDAQLSGQTTAKMRPT